MAVGGTSCFLGKGVTNLDELDGVFAVWLIQEQHLIHF